jgi:O-antigen biosynthesis protein
MNVGTGARAPKPPMNMSPASHSVSIVVPAWNWARRDELAACLQAIERQTLTPLEVIVVIDHNPELLEWVGDRFPRVRAVENRHERGVVGARNTGTALARGDLVVLTDDDTVAEPTWIENLEACFADTSVVGVTGELLPRWSGEEPRWFPYEFYWVFGCSYAGLPAELAPVRNPIAANMAVRRWALEEVSGFRQGVAPRQIRHRGAVVAGGHALEDTELGIRIGRRWPEMQWLYQPHATVFHRVNQEQATPGYLLRRSFEEGAGKAALAQAVGSEQGLDSERRHLLTVIPRGVLGGLGDLLHGKPAGLVRSAMIVAGIAAAACGYASAVLGSWLASRDDETAATPPGPAPNGFHPVEIVEVEIGEALPRIEARLGESGSRYGAVFCLVRLHGQPLGIVEVELPPSGLEPTSLAESIEAALAEAIDEHLSADGLDRRQLGPEGLQSPDRSPCRIEREEFLARAPFISVVIPTRDRPERAAAAIDSVLRCDYPPDRYEVILVDNRPDGAADLTGATTGTLADERVRVLHEPVPGGANARNTGMANARGEIVAFTDDDVVADRDWLITVARAFDGQPGVGAASGLVMPLELETQAQVWFEGYARFSGRFHRRAYDLGPNRPQDDPLFPFDIGVLGTGANMAFRVEALRQAGCLDPAFNTQALPNGTDVEALFRVMLRGWTVVHDPGAIVQHAHQREYHQLERRVYGYGLGLTAVLTKSLLQNPRLVPELARKLPRGIAFALSPSSAKNADKAEDFPAALSRLEIRGMLRGPLAYARGRREARRRREANAPSPGG